MEWYIMNADGLNAMAQDVCCYLDGELAVSDECEDILLEIDSFLENDDRVQYPVRRHFGCCSFIQRSLVPLLVHCEDKDIIRLCLKIMCHLTQPVDCVDVGLVPPHVLTEISSHITQVQTLFSEGLVLVNLSRHLIMLFKESGNKMLEPKDVDMTNYILIILRNLLYEVDGFQTKYHRKIKEAMVHNGMYEAILTLLASKQQELWCVHLVQLISLIFKDEINVPVSVMGTEDSGSAPFSPDGTECDSTEMVTDSCEDTFSSSTNSAHTSHYSQCMEKFIKTFLLEGFSSLVQNLQNILLSCNNKTLSDCYYMWCVGHFISYCKPNMMPAITEVLSADVFSFLVFKGIESCEQILMAAKRKLPTGQLVRKNYLVVKALQELLQIIRMYRNAGSHPEYISQLLNDLVNMKDLHQLFLLLIRLYDPAYQGIEYLGDVIMTNHVLLVLLEEFTRNLTTEGIDMLKHVTQFGTRPVMAQYGLVLDTFKNNPDFLNESVFTMMHHVAGDCGRHDSLLQFPIIKTFVEIGDEQKQLPEEYVDLMEFVFNNMTQLAEENPEKCAEQILAIKSVGKDEEQSLWSEEEMSELFSLYNEHQDASDVVGHLVRELDDMGYTKTRSQVLQQLYISGLTDEQTIGSLLEKDERTRGVVEMVGKSKMMLHSEDTEEVVSYLVQDLCASGAEHSVKWLQETLLDACHAKLGTRKSDQFKQSVLWNYIRLEKSIPLVPYNDAEASALKNGHFKALLHSLGFYMEEGGFIFPRIPWEWNSSDLLSKAKQLGPVDFEHLPFTEEEVSQPGEIATMDMISSTPDNAVKKSSVPESLWIMLVQKCNLQQVQATEQKSVAYHRKQSAVDGQLTHLGMG